MLRLRIRFEGSWTNSFSFPDGSPRFRSGTALRASASDLVPVRPDPNLSGRPGSLTAFVQALQSANPGLAYRVPTSFDDTVRGVLARLVGEVRRLRHLVAHRPDHLALRAFERGRYRIDVDRERSETMRLATGTGNLSRFAGEGIVQDRPLFDDPEIGRRLFGHLELEIEDLVATLASGATPGGSWTGSSPDRLCARLLDLERRQDALVAEARRAARAEDRAYVSPLAPAAAWFARTFPDQIAPSDRGGRDSSDRMHRLGAESVVTSGALERASLAGAVASAHAKALDGRTRETFVREHVLSREGNVRGLRMAGAVGRVTPRDIFSGATGVRSRSRRLQYSVEVPIDCGPNRTPPRVECGVIVRSGRLRFELDGDERLERELFDAIERAAVGPFHFGKKGVAYIEALERIPDRSRSDV